MWSKQESQITPEMWWLGVKMHILNRLPLSHSLSLSLHLFLPSFSVCDYTSRIISYITQCNGGQEFSRKDWREWRKNTERLSLFSIATIKHNSSVWDVNTFFNICYRLVLGLSQFSQDLCLQKTDKHQRLSHLQALRLITCSGLNTNLKMFERLATRQKLLVGQTENVVAIFIHLL